MYYYVYEDDGPSGACGQSTYITAPWRFLLKSDDEIGRDDLNKAIRKLRRRNMRITGMFSDKEESGYDICKKISAADFAGMGY
jgi:hypothetical protein